MRKVRHELQDTFRVNVVGEQQQVVWPLQNEERADNSVHLHWQSRKAPLTTEAPVPSTQCTLIGTFDVMRTSSTIQRMKSVSMHHEFL